MDMYAVVRDLVKRQDEHEEDTRSEFKRMADEIEALKERLVASAERAKKARAA